MLKDQLAVDRVGVASAVSTGQSAPTLYWPGGSRGSRARRPRNPLVKVMRQLSLLGAAWHYSALSSSRRTTRAGAAGSAPALRAPRRGPGSVPAPRESARVGGEDPGEVQR